MSKSSIAFSGTKDQEKQLKSFISAHKSDPGPLIMIMQEAQKIYGYLPEEVQRIISKELNIPMEKVYEVATFYAQFNLVPRGKYHISVCLGTACYVKGSGKILEAIEQQLKIKNGECTADRKFSLDSCRCLGACGLAPVMKVNEEVYGKLTPDMVPKILAEFK
ncbi:MAG: NAD(P)H-dependent oxidoreductase subunit E [Lachnospiraceae bacterium]|nr:NAD(P)H-dependent oxidoreductase subunit E [Lachnospiraceae bacterium]